MRGFLVGAILGAVAAVLVAPRRGEETRELVRTRLELWQDQVLNKIEQSRAELEATQREMLARLDDIRSQFAKGGGQMESSTERTAEGEGMSPEHPGGA